MPVHQDTSVAESLLYHATETRSSKHLLQNDALMREDDTKSARETRIKGFPSEQPKEEMMTAVMMPSTR